jgi:hypothetical protein
MSIASGSGGVAVLSLAALPYVLHWLALVVIAALVMHVQVSPKSYHHLAMAVPSEINCVGYDTFCGFVSSIVLVRHL